MTKRKKRPSKAEQEVIAEDVQKSTLKRQIARLHQLPDDFRDIMPGTKAWRDYGEILGYKKQKEMEAWLRAPVLLASPLDKAEEKYFAGTKLQLLPTNVLNTDHPEESFLGLAAVITIAEEKGCSHIYLPTFSRTDATALNRILSKCKSNVRVKSQLVDEQGNPVGVVY